MGASACRLPDSVPAALSELLRRIVEVAKPEAVILFGSHAEGRAAPTSDVDLLVVASTDNTWKTTAALYAATARLAGGSAEELPSFDIVVMTPEQWREESQLPGHLAFRVRRRGVTVHGRAA